MVKQKKTGGYELVNKKKEAEVVASPLHDDDDIEAPEDVFNEPEKAPSPWWKVAALIIPSNWRGVFSICFFYLINFIVD